MAFFAKPQFHLSLSDMNTVRVSTRQSSRLFTKVWGNIGDKVFLMTRAHSRKELQDRNDRLLEKLNRDMADGRIKSAFNPSMIFPGNTLASRNLKAWRAFWTPKRAEHLRDLLSREGAAMGFTPKAFQPFLDTLRADTALQTGIPPASYDELLGITARGADSLIQFTSITPGKKYDSTTFLQDYGKDNKIFDGRLFSNRLGELLFSTFSSSLMLMFPVIALMLLLYFLNWRLTLLTLLPLVFAFICTLGTLNIIGHPIDIPGLMLTVVILGLGVDYSIYTVCGRQRYGSNDHESYVLVRSAVVLSAVSTLIGFGVLCFAEHSTLRSVGITSLCGIGYSFLGTILILPPLLESYFNSPGDKSRLRAPRQHPFKI